MATKYQYGTYGYGEMPVYEDQYAAQINALKDSIAGAENYQSKYSNEISNATNNYNNANTAYSDWQNRGFSYDPNQDATYGQYKDSYTRQGQQAMNDTLGKVASKTGGLASAYATVAAQQQYNQYMQALADKIPELQALAYTMYQDEGNTLLQNMNNAKGIQDNYLALEDANYNSWNNQMNDYYNRLNALQTLQSNEYQKYLNEYQQYQDMIAQQQAAAKASSGSYSGGGGSEEGYDYLSGSGSIGYTSSPASSSNFSGVQDVVSLMSYMAAPTSEGGLGYGSQVGDNSATWNTAQKYLESQGYSSQQAKKVVSQAKRNYRQN